MISRTELEEYARRRGIKNIGHAEKDYFQNVILFIIYQHFGKELVFKGGTALSKCYGLNRFSEDLDFSSEKAIDFSFIESGLKNFRIEYELERKSFERSESVILRIAGPLFTGSKNSRCKLILDVSFRETPVITPSVKTLGRFLEEIPNFDVYVMSLEEIFSEKVRAVLTRNKARDVYDLCFLASLDVTFNKKLTNEKLKYYNLSFDEKKFIKAVLDKKTIWTSELSGLVDKVPAFEDVLKEIKKSLEI